jgi:uncharacterized membrane protein YadS
LPYCYWFCISGLISPPLALVLGLVAATFQEIHFTIQCKSHQCFLLQLSVGLGFGMNVNSALSAGKMGSYILLLLSSVLYSWVYLGRWLKIDSKISHLISCGTAICGGSAIAAIAPVIQSDEKQTSVALGVILS